MTRTGEYDDALVTLQIDQLAYTYPSNSNRLTKVEDASSNLAGFKDGPYQSNGIEYTYDANGNMITDTNKGIREIFYNHLNLPINIAFVTTPLQVTYRYNALGQKVMKSVKYPAPTKRYIWTASNI